MMMKVIKQGGKWIILAHFYINSASFYLLDSIFFPFKQRNWQRAQQCILGSWDRSQPFPNALLCLLLAVWITSKPSILRFYTVRRASPSMFPRMLNPSKYNVKAAKNNKRIVLPAFSVQWFKSNNQRLLRMHQCWCGTKFIIAGLFIP